MKKNHMICLVLSALFLAIGFVLPFLTGQIPEVGSMLLPLHLPALICGFVCGWPWGLLVGFVLPIARSLLLGMPPLVPTALAMAFEMAGYGAVAAFCTSGCGRAAARVCRADRAPCWRDARYGGWPVGRSMRF